MPFKNLFFLQNQDSQQSLECGRLSQISEIHMGPEIVNDYKMINEFNNLNGSGSQRRINEWDLDQGSQNSCIMILPKHSQKLYVYDPEMIGPI